jgi:hypothetical protein
VHACHIKRAHEPCDALCPVSPSPPSNNRQLAPIPRRAIACALSAKQAFLAQKLRKHWSAAYDIA